MQTVKTHLQLILSVLFLLAVLAIAFFKPDALVIPLEVWDNVAASGWALVPVATAFALLQGGLYLKAMAGAAEATMWERRHRTKRDNKFDRKYN